MTTPLDRAALLARRHDLTTTLVASPYDLLTYLERAAIHAALEYPDLAAGDAYRALLLTDEVFWDDFEFHEPALEAFKAYPPVAAEDDAASLPAALAGHVRLEDVSRTFLEAKTAEGEAVVGEHVPLMALATVRAFQILSYELLVCGCLASAWDFCTRGLEVAPTDQALLRTQVEIRSAAQFRLRRDDVDMASLPDHGRVRREVYPWNDHEPDRFSAETLAHLNSRLAAMAPKCEVRVATLPVLTEGRQAGADGAAATCRQLGVFAKEDIGPGDVVLREYSVLTASSRLKESVCDACSADLPALSKAAAEKNGGSGEGGGGDGPVNCPNCHDAVFCNEFCLEQAQARYHPAVCDLDSSLDTVAKDPDQRESDDALYLLLLARLLAMAAHDESHPLDVPEVRYLWGDFLPAATLPFSFKYNIASPLHVLEKMDVDAYAALDRCDQWVFNTLYAKFRGTASARKSTRDGMPDVAAVHPFWCLANHDCDPNVEWEWGGDMKLHAREQRVDLGDGRERRVGGLRAGEEVLNHYCDVDMGVKDRRDWAMGSLGGACMCLRCRREAGEVG